MASRRGFWSGVWRRTPSDLSLTPGAFDHPSYASQEAFDARTDELLTQEATAAFARADVGADGFQSWWLSFVDTSLPYQSEQDYPGGGRFLGVAIVEALGFMDAVLQANALGANPGGQVSGWPVFHEVPVEYRNRLLSAGEAAEVQG